jgi:uncharacterized protein involved in exopolysaccharide biosynthesis
MAETPATGLPEQPRPPLTSWWSILLASVAAAAFVGVLVFVFMPLRWGARASLLSGDGGASSMAAMAEAFAPGIASAAGDVTSSVPRFETILRSYRVREDVIHRTRLTERLAIEDDEAPDRLTAMTSLRNQPGAAIVVEVTCTGPSRLQSWLGRRTVLSTVEAQQLCAEVANAYVEALRTYLVFANRSNTRFIRTRRDEVEVELAKLDDRLQAFRSQHALVDPQGSADVLTTQVKAVVQAYGQAQADREAARQSLVTDRARLARSDLMRVQSVVTARNPVLDSVSRKLAEDRVALGAALEGGKRPSHPDVLALEDSIKAGEHELAGVTREIRTQVERTTNPNYDSVLGQVAAHEIGVVQATARCATLQRQLGEVQRQMASLPAVMRQYGELQLRRDIKGQLLASLSKQLETAILDEKREAADKFQVLDQAFAPTIKSGPSSVRSAAMAFLLTGMLLGLYALRRSGLFGPEALS